jgi:uncharacterized membrane protein
MSMAKRPHSNHSKSKQAKTNQPSSTGDQNSLTESQGDTPVNTTKNTPPKHKPSKAADKKSAYKTERQPNLGLIALAAVGLAITSYLTGVAWLDEAPAFCSTGSSCDVIQNSRWSTVLGLPLALWGFGLYAVIAFLAFRPASAIKRWKQIWSVSLLGVVLSVYLTLVGFISLDAICAWCLASLIVISAIFIANAVYRPTIAPEMPWWNWNLNSGIAALVAVVVIHLYYNSDILQAPQDPQMVTLVAHLQSTGAKFYGASWCTSCQRQKKIFGALAKDLPYVECSPFGRSGAPATECTIKGIDNFPTWIIKNKPTVGVLEPEELARLSGFVWKKDSDGE